MSILYHVKYRSCTKHFKRWQHILYASLWAAEVEMVVMEIVKENHKKRYITKICRK